MSKKKNNKGKKKDDELEYEMRMNALLDIEILKNKIHWEEQREVQAKADYEEITKQTSEKHTDIEKTEKEEIKIIRGKSDQWKGNEDAHQKVIYELQRQIRDRDNEILELQKNLEIKAQKDKEEEDERDQNIQDQRKWFDEMTVRFQHILENTANKLQERVKMGS